MKYLISGGNGGIGQAVSEQLVSKGHIPIIGYANTQPDAEHAIHLDLTNKESIEKAISYLTEEHPDLAGVVLAGSPPPKIDLFTRITDADMEQQLQVNVIGVQTLLAGLTKKIFKKNKSGSVIGILTSAMGNSTTEAMSQMGAYTIAKYGMLGTLKTLKADYKWLNVQTVSPGFTETKMLNAFDERFLDMMRAEKSFQTAEEVAQEIVAKLCGEIS